LVQPTWDGICYRHDTQELKIWAGPDWAEAVVFPFTTIATYIALCVSSVAGLQRLQLGPLER
jgi:hypothetical protein